MNSCGYGEFSNNFAVDIQDCTGIDENSKSDYTIYPNPANDFLVLETSNAKTEDLSLRIFNVLGETVFNKDIKYSSESTFKIDLSQMGEGVYFIRIASKTATEIKKIIIRK